MQARDIEALRSAMRERGLSQRQLARLARCSPPTPGRLLQGRATEDTTAVRLARALGRPVGQLFEDAASSNERQGVEREAAV